MKTCFGFMFWGLLLVVLDFNVDHFDSAAGRVGIRIGGRLGPAGWRVLTGNFITATSLNWLLVGGSVIGPFVSGDVGTIVGVFMAVLNCAMMWTLLGGIMDIAIGRHRLDLAERAAHRRSVYVAVMAVSMVLGLIVHGSGGAIGLLALILVMAGLTVMFLILHLIYRDGRNLVRSFTSSG